MKTIPSDDEISNLESKLAEMRKIRESAKSDAVRQLKAAIEAIPDVIPPQEAASLFTLFERKVRFGRKNPRGTRISEETKAKLMDVLKNENKSLSELEKMFNLSISFISKIKKQLRDKGELKEQKVQQPAA